MWYSNHQKGKIRDIWQSSPRRDMWYSGHMVVYSTQKFKSLDMRYSNHQNVNIMIVNTWDTWFARPQIGLGPWLKLPAWKVGDRGFEHHSVLQVSKKQTVFPRSLVKIQYCGEPLWPRGSVLGLRPPGLEFRILCLEGSVISFISPSSGVLLA